MSLAAVDGKRRHDAGAFARKAFVVARTNQRTIETSRLDDEAVARIDTAENRIDPRGEALAQREISTARGVDGYAKFGGSAYRTRVVRNDFQRAEALVVCDRIQLALESRCNFRSHCCRQLALLKQRSAGRTHAPLNSALNNTENNDGPQPHVGAVPRSVFYLRLRAAGDRPAVVSALSALL